MPLPPLFLIFSSSEPLLSWSFVCFLYFVRRGAQTTLTACRLVKSISRSREITLRRQTEMFFSVKVWKWNHSFEVESTLFQREASYWSRSKAVLHACIFWWLFRWECVELENEFWRVFHRNHLRREPLLIMFRNVQLRGLNILVPLWSFVVCNINCWLSWDYWWSKDVWYMVWLTVDFGRPDLVVSTPMAATQKEFLK